MVDIGLVDTCLRPMTLRRYDLNLLTVLDALLRHRNVTRAGRELGLSQSATSGALMRLREQFGDPLLVQEGRALQLSRRAQDMAGPVAAALEQVQRIIETQGFEPSRSDRQMRIGTADYIGLLLLPRLSTELQRAAPRMAIQLTWTGGSMPEKLRSGELDLALVPRGTLDNEDLHSRFLFHDDVVVAGWTDNPDIGSELDLETYQRLPKAGFRNTDPSARSFAEGQLAHSQIATRAAIVVADFLLLPLMLPGTPFVCLIQRRLGEKVAAMAPIKLWKPPFPTERLLVHAYWSHTADSDPAHCWFRNRLFAICENLR